MVVGVRANVRSADAKSDVLDDVDVMLAAIDMHLAVLLSPFSPSVFQHFQTLSITLRANRRVLQRGWPPASNY
jgi:hypothetical protein